MTEVIVTIALIAVMIAAVSLTAASRLRRGQSGAIATQLDNLRVAIAAYRRDVHRYPRRLYQLTNAPPAGDLDACGSPVSAANRNRWNGPYLSRVVDGDFPAGDATLRDTLVRVPATTGGGPLGQLQIVAVEVDSLVAAEIERQHDAAYSLTSGTILWSSAGGGTLRLQISISGC